MGSLWVSVCWNGERGEVDGGEKGRMSSKGNGRERENEGWVES